MFKGPVQPSAMNLREELETVAGDGTLLLRLLEELGFHVWFRYQKYREEFVLDDVIVAIDETPVGTYGKSKAASAGIATTTEARVCPIGLSAQLVPRAIHPSPPGAWTACHRHALRR